jgi:KaiC/GvpD/RAD55 family RecA-like ATPase
MSSVTGRALSIVKMRNSDHSKDVYRFTIDQAGLTVGANLEGVTGVLGWSALRASETGSRTTTREVGTANPLKALR